ncbi:MAG: FHA domain-containing protein [Kiritimatiellia bacterium]
MEQPDWYVICLLPDFIMRVNEFPFYVGREPGESENCVVVDEPSISRKQFLLERRDDGQLWYVNRSGTNKGRIDGVYADELPLSPDAVHVLRVGGIVIGLGTQVEAVAQVVADKSVDLYSVDYHGKVIGPLTRNQILDGYKKKYFGMLTRTWLVRDPEQVFYVADAVKLIRKQMRTRMRIVAPPPAGPPPAATEAARSVATRIAPLPKVEAALDRAVRIAPRPPQDDGVSAPPPLPKFA